MKIIDAIGRFDEEMLDMPYTLYNVSYVICAYKGATPLVIPLIGNGQKAMTF